VVPLPDNLAVKQVDKSTQFFQVLFVVIDLVFKFYDVLGSEFTLKKLFLVKSKLHLASCACCLRNIEVYLCLCLNLAASVLTADLLLLLVSVYQMYNSDFYFLRANWNLSRTRT
jgi:hypothetical protein